MCFVSAEALTRAIASGTTFQGTPRTTSPHYKYFQLYLVLYHDVAPVYTPGSNPKAFRKRTLYQRVQKEAMEKETEDRWNKMKEVAIGHGSSNKVLEIIVLDH